MLAIATTLVVGGNSETVNTTQGYKTTILGQEGPKMLDIGDQSGLTGLEINFWMKPERSTNDEASVSILKFLSLIDVQYQLWQSPANVFGNSLVMKYAGKTYNATYPLTNPYQWMNVNLRVQFATYINLCFWQGLFKTETAPDGCLTHSNPQAFTNFTISLGNMTDNLHAYMAEIRIFALDSTQSWGQYFKYYHGIWPSPSIYEGQVQYYTGFEGNFYFDIANTQKYIINTSPITFPVERCIYGQYISAKTGADPSTLPVSPWVTDNQCNYCAEKDCLLCPINYLGTCKLCSNSKTSTCKLDTTSCPQDYYLSNGICLRCPPGCNGCTSARNCLDCDSGLVMYQNLTHKVCKCVEGKFGTNDYANDQLICSPCNQNFCQYCESSATYCTQCFKSKGLYLYENTCVSDCKAQPNPSYTNVTDQKCYYCGSYCTDCVNSTYCNSGQCLWDMAGGTVTYNHNGQCTEYCPDSSLANQAMKTCDDCAKNCAVCVGNTNNCTVCQLGYVLNEAQCVTTCPDGKYPDTSNVCQVCPSQCVLCLAASQCTKCVNKGPGFPLESYYYVNFQCVLECPDRYYKDSLDPWDLFCRSCPSGCNQCSDENTCTVCDIGWYLDSFYGGTKKLCVSKCQPGYYPDNSTMVCKPCLSGCNSCDNSTHCAKCSKGMVLNVGAVSTTCLDTCSDGYYSDSQNTCQHCISGCKRCHNNYTCDECNLGNYLLENTKSCVASTCPQGYFMSSSNCLMCRPQCQTCSAALTCDTCIVGYEYKSGQCNIKCGNSQREDNEECDDGNGEDDDGCSAICQIETGYDCKPLDITTKGPDVCFCDPNFQSASWTASWGQMEIVFASTIIFNTANGAKNSDAKIFCSQILDPSMLANNNLGTEYSCFLDASATQSTIRINVDLDAGIGNNQMNFSTQVTLNYDSLRVKDCPTSIPLTYYLTNLPLDSPKVYIQTSHNGLVVPQCSSYWGLNIFTSKGFTKRNVAVVWTIISMNPDNSDLKTELQDYLDNNYKNVKYFEFLADQIEQLAGTSLTIKVVVTNFLGISGSNSTTVQFSNMKSLLLVDLQDIYTFETAVDNTLAPRVRIPYCSSDNSSLQETQLQYVNILCTLYSYDLLKKTPLTNCTIRAFNMTLGNSYKVKVQAVNLRDPNMGVTKWVHIDTASPKAGIAYISGCNRLFSVNNSFDLESMISTNVSYAKFNWFCTHVSTGSPCFTTSFSYITIANTKKVTVAGGQLFANNTYLFTVIVLDQLSQTQISSQCNMYAAPIEQNVLDIVIDTEANKNGFIDFNSKMAAFKVQTINMENIDRTQLSFKWKFTDSSGMVFKNEDLSVYQNSLGVLISKLERSNVYKVETNATYGQYQGYIRTFYETEPQMSFQFSVEPPSGEPLRTIFTFSVTSQATLDGLYQYVFGYVNPVDKISNIPIYQKSTNRYQRTQLPVPEGQTYLTCYVQVTLPSGESKSYLQNVTLTIPTTSVDEFKTQLNSAVMDDLVESMQIKNKLVVLSSRMTISDRTFAIKQILKGLQGENTPLSDYNIQSSVASLLEYISLQSDSLLSDPQPLTVASQIFQQMTIGENKDIDNGKYSQFGRAATFSLYNFANNIFQKDFSTVIGGQTQLQMKVMFMKGLKNILKGSLSNQILGDDGGGFFYQGQNIYVKAVKFDQLESNYKINASLPISLNGQLIQNFVNITLPSPSSPSNPCSGQQACQVSIIILDSPSNTFISNSKDSRLMSIFVDVSIQATELSSPFNYVKISDISVNDLVDPIKMTIPLLIQFTDSSGNRTLGCGYLDETDQIFKAEGVKATIINSKLVTCQAYHLTAIGVEEYTVDQQSIVTDTSVIVSNSTTTNTLATDKALQVIDMWGSWAVYNTFILLGALIGGIVWGYTRDKRDELNLRKVLMNKEKIYMNLFLEPLPNDELARAEDDENDYEAIQQEKARRMEAKRRKLEERAEQFRGAKVDTNAPVKGLFSPEEMMEKFGVDLDGKYAALKRQQEEAEKAEKKKKKKKKKVVDANNDMFFEGGENILPEYIEVNFEGGEEEQKEGDDAEDEAAQSVKVKGKKKKKKKSNTLKSNNKADTFKEQDTLPAAAATETKVAIDDAASVAPGGAQSPKQATDLVLEELDGKSVKSKKSRKTVKKKKTSKSKEKKKAVTLVSDGIQLPPEEEVEFNNNGLKVFNFTQNPDQQALNENQAEDLQADENRSRKSKKGSKRKGKGSRSSSAHRQRVIEEDNALGEEDNHLKPDFEAEEYSPSKKRQAMPPPINREDLFKPISEMERDRLNQDINFSPDMDKKSQKTTKKKGKKKKLKKKQEVEESDSDDDEEEQQQEQKKDREEDEEPSGCCQFCFWNFREGHRCLSFFSYYNAEMSRPVRATVLVMSWYLFMTFSGFFMGAKEYIGSKSMRAEQFICGFMAALFVRPWILAITYFVMHPKPNTIYEIIANKIKANREIRTNMLKFYIGVAIITITIIFCAGEAFSLSATYNSGLVQNWAWAFLFSIIADFFIVDGIFMSVVTIITVNVGVTPDACGQRRDFLLKLIPPAVKDSIE